MTARAVWAGLPTIGIVAFLVACAPAHTPAATGRAAPADVPAAASHDQAPRHYRSSTNTRPRPRPTARRIHHHYEVQQARADTVNPPFDAGE